MKTIIECPYCREAISIVRKIANGHEVILDIYCPHCKRHMDIEFEIISNLPYLLAYFDKNRRMTGIRVKKSKKQRKMPAYQIRYHDNSIDASVNEWYKETSVRVVECANCGRLIRLHQEKSAKDVHGLFCNYCAREFRYSHEFLSAFYDAEQAKLKESVDQESKMEEKRMAIKNTIIGFVLEKDGMYKIYNPQSNQLANVSAVDFESLCLGEFPYRKVRANTLADGEVVETLDGKVYYVSDATKNELFDFETGKIERSAVVTNLMVKTNCYIKYVPVLKYYCTFSDVSSDNIDPRIAKMIEVIANDIQDGGTSTESNVLAKMVRFLTDPAYKDLLDTEALTDMVMADPQAFMVMGQMTNMQLAQSIISNQGAIPLSVQQPHQSQQSQQVQQLQQPQPNVQETSEADECKQLETETYTEYKGRLTVLMEDAAKNYNYELAAKYQKALKQLIVK